jgi:hypothetical protein
LRKGESGTTEVGPLAVPPNDNFPGLIVGALAYTDGPRDTTSATGEAGEPSEATCSVGTLNSIWYSFTANFDGTMVVDTIGSNYDTTLSVYTGAAVGSLTFVGCNDDWSGLQSRVSVSISAGTTYRFQVDGYGANGGNAQINIALPHDNFADRGVVTALPFTDGSSPPYTVDTTTATTEDGEPVPPCGFNVGRTVWYSFTPGSDGDLTVDTYSSAYDTVLAAYTGSDLGTLVNVACSDDATFLRTFTYQSRMSFSVTAGTTYQIQAGGYYGAGGPLVLHISGPQNDNTYNETDIWVLNAAFERDTRLATDQAGEPQPCGGIGGATWYTYTTGGSGEGLFASTFYSNYDTVLAVYVDLNGVGAGGVSGPNPAAVVGCNDDYLYPPNPAPITWRSGLVFSAFANTTYWFQVGGFGGEKGSIQRFYLVQQQEWPLFSISAASPSATTSGGTLHPADILLANAGTPSVVGPCAFYLSAAGCDGAGAEDDLSALSLGGDTFVTAGGLYGLGFSVAPGAQGSGSNGVTGEAGCTPPEPQADEFALYGPGYPLPNFDGDGYPCDGWLTFPLGLKERVGPPVDDLDALSEGAGPGLYFTLAPGSPTLGLFGAGPADVLRAWGPPVYAPSAALGLQAGDVIDALCLVDDGDSIYGSADSLAISLAPGSPSLDAVDPPFSPGALLWVPFGGTPVRLATVGDLGLLGSDDLDAAKCDLGDLDLDGMPNMYEYLHSSCLNSGFADGGADPDGDGVSNLTEFLQWNTDPCNPDSDGDGCAESEELGSNQYLGGQRGPLDGWDFYDVPLPVGDPGTGTKDQQIDINDAFGVLAKFGSHPANPPGAPPYDSAYDRSTPTGGYPGPTSWLTEDPAIENNGVQLDEFFWNLASFGHSCFPPP